MTINRLYPCKPQFFYIRVGFKAVFFARTCYPDAQFTLILEDDDQYNMKIDHQQLVIYLDALNRVWLSFMTCFITVHQTYLDFMTLGVEWEVKT